MEIVKSETNHNDNRHLHNQKLNARYWKLLEFELVSKLTKEELDNLVQVIQHENLKGGDDFLVKGRKRLTSNIYFIKKGAVKVTCYLENGDEVIKQLYNEGEILGILNLYEDDDCEDYITALEDAQVCVLDTQYFMDLLGKNKLLKDYVLKLIVKRVKKIEQNFSFLMGINSISRIENFLLSFLKDFGVEENGNVVAKNLLSNGEIATITSTSRQTVNKVMNDLRRKNIICFNREEIWMQKPGNNSKK